MGKSAPGVSLIPSQNISKNIFTVGSIPQPSHFLVKQSDWCYILGSPYPLIGNQVKHLLIIFSILLLSSPVIGDNHKG